MHSDPVDPGLQAGFAMEVLHPPEDFQEYFLRRIRGIRRIGHDPVHQAVDRLMELADQPLIGIFLSGF